MSFSSFTKRGLPALLTVSLMFAPGQKPAQADAPPGPDPRAPNIVAKSLVGTKGFIRIGQTADGYWWFVAPDGAPFFYRGVAAVNRAGTAGGRRAKPGPYAVAVDRKYDYQKSPERFATSEIARLRQWGFNALGAWTTDEFFDHGMPYTEIVEFNYVGKSIRLDKLDAAQTDVPDVFDPEWEKAADEKARLICAPRRDSRDLVGYFTDNELGWAQPDSKDVDDNPQAAFDPKGRLTLLQEALSLPQDRPACRAAWDFVLRRHGGTRQETARAWGIPELGESRILEWTRASRALTSAGYRADCDAFSHEIAHRYFETTARLIRKYDPNHLILGCRFGSEPGPAILTECKRPYVDVLSANNYRDTMSERVTGYYEATKLPVLIGEFSWASDYFSKPTPAASDFAAASALPMPERMLRRGEATLRRAAKNPALLGYTWYRWDSKWDKAQPDKIPYGLVDMDDDPIALHADLLTTINPDLTDLHRK